MTTSGINIRQSTGRILFRVSLKDAAGAKVTSGTTELRVYRLEDDGTLDVYDWTTNDFVAPGAGTPDDETTMVHRQRRDSTGVDVNTGVWTAVLSTLTNFVAGTIYIIQITNTNAFPESQEREIQFGGDIQAGLTGDLTGKVIGDGITEILALGVWAAADEGNSVFPANAIQIGGSTPAAARLALGANSIFIGAVDDSVFSPIVTRFETDSAAITVFTGSGHFNNRVIFFTSGNLQGQAVEIQGYTIQGSNARFVVSEMTEVPANNDTFIIV